MTAMLKTADLISAGNVRSDVDTGLAQSIHENGILEPISVYRLGNDWVVQDGHRRLAGAIAAGLEEVPYKEVSAPADKALQIAAQFIINQHRKSLSYLDQANVYASLIEEFGWKQKEVAAKLGVSEATVSLALTALRAHPTIQDALLSGKISPSAAELVTSLPYEEQGAIADRVVAAKTVRKITDVVRSHKKMVSDTTKAVVDEDSVDPMESMAVDGMEQALRNLQLAEMAIISDPTLRARGVAAITEILRLAERLQSYLLESREVVYEYDYEDA